MKKILKLAVVAIATFVSSANNCGSNEYSGSLPENYEGLAQQAASSFAGHLRSKDVITLRNDGPNTIEAWITGYITTDRHTIAAGQTKALHTMLEGADYDCRNAETKVELTVHVQVPNIAASKRTFSFTKNYQNTCGLNNDRIALEVKQGIMGSGTIQLYTSLVETYAATPAPKKAPINKEPNTMPAFDSGNYYSSAVKKDLPADFKEQLRAKQLSMQ